jgi:alkylation response protein AidB-like acyl-CoA dehydrogenase
MTDGAARLLQIHLSKPDLDGTKRMVFQNAFDHLISRDPTRGWTSGQWMTERTGGSDVSLTETVATYSPSNDLPPADAVEGIPLGPWSVSGFKWFSSATDSSMTILLARTEKGISAFYAPMRRQDHDATTMVGTSKGKLGKELNGVRIQRLKEKFGTRSVPTAELELDGMRAWLVGEEGRGIHEISSILTITRLHSTIACLGYVGRGLGVARAYAKIRQVGAGRRRRMFLTDSPLHMRTLADLTTKYHGLMLLTFFTIYVFGLEEHPNSPLGEGNRPLGKLTVDKVDVSPLLRVLTPLLKSYACKTSILLMYGCMESLGGVGYLANEEQEYINLTRLFRDLCVNSIWEGTTEVLATDFVRALKHLKGGRESLNALDSLIRHHSWPVDQKDGFENWNPIVVWEKIQTRILGTAQDELVEDALQLVWGVAEALIGVLMFVDSESDGSQPARDMFTRFVAERKNSSTLSEAAGVEGRLERDRAIVYGTSNEKEVPLSPKI